MAGGRHGDYKDNEFRERPSDFGMSRKESGYKEGDIAQTRMVGWENGRAPGHGKDGFDYRNRLKQKAVKEIEMVNGSYHSSLSRIDSGVVGMPKRCGMAIHPDDREPGELSSDGSDGVPDPGAGKEAVDGNQLTPLQNKRRKFSPIVWDRDDREVKKASNHKSVTPSVESYSGMPNSNSVSDTNVKTSVADDSMVHVSEAPPSKTDTISYFSESHEEASSAQNQSEPLVENQELRAVYDDDEMPARSIISSRWANDADSPADEGEISDMEDNQRFKKISSSVSSGFQTSVSPEFGELKRESSLGMKGRASGSVEHAKSSSRDSYHDIDDGTDYMDIDDKHEGINVFQTGSESVDDYGSAGTPESQQFPQRSVNMLQGCRSVDEFERLNKIDEGTYGVVYRARDKKSGEIVALKKVKMEKEREGFPLTSLREINILLSFHHPSIVDVKEVVVGSNLDSIFMVMEYMEHDLKGLMESMKQPFSQSEVKCLMLQLLEGIKYLHDNWVLHRDLKTSNLLLNNRGELKICDFGLARQYGSPLKPYTHLVVTLWYRAPELLLGAKLYSTAIDMWSLGCIMAELLSKEPLFNGKTEVDQLDKIFKILGTPTEKIWPGLSELPGAKVNFVKHKYNMLRKKFPATSFTGSPVLSDAGFDLLNKLLTYDPEKRIAVGEALNHEWFSEVPMPKSKEFMPTFPAQHAQDRRLRRVFKSPDPLEEQRKKELLQGDLGTVGLFGQ
ncbi:hypothetical protein M569_03427 [Genlisea aurea]|uniref:cyclin-dependent kinase n=1 Tax=Genlisea aurea TaxID=192259 RepID=S8D1Y1_9LAMI|nr:hypothetical protein M569_03427 [Genlisea aurea]